MRMHADLKLGYSSGAHGRGTALHGAAQRGIA